MKSSRRAVRSSSPTRARSRRSGITRCSKSRPDWAGLIALHHGSLDQEVREWVERGLKNGQLKAVVCTSSLDLGVDFLPVERVFQIGSPKGVARLMQRAGPLGPRARPGVARDDRADARARTRRSGGGALGRRGAAHRRPRDAGETARRAGPASRDGGDRRRFQGARTVRRSPQRLRVSRPDAAGVRLGARVRRARRHVARGVSGLPPRDARRRRRLSRAARGPGPAASQQCRHDRRERDHQRRVS